MNNIAMYKCSPKVLAVKSAASKFPREQNTHTFHFTTIDKIDNKADMAEGYNCSKHAKHQVPIVNYPVDLKTRNQILLINKQGTIHK